jgi:radical SAM family uncharacterized protein/radical SAM-linked protein
VYPRAILSQVEKPGRYVDAEYNCEGTEGSPRVSICLAYPDVYEVGMSYQGLFILYHLLNALPGVRCERVFAPWRDMEQELRKRGLPLTSLESGRPLSEFDAVGFSLQHEMGYTNVLAMLDLGGIPLFARDRREDDPIVLAGGPSAVNPAVMSAYIDAFYLGESEENLPRTMDAIAIGNSRDEILAGLAEVPGVYVPSHSLDQGISPGLAGVRAGGAAGGRVRYQTVDPERTFYPTRPIVPSLTPVHDRFTVEVRRGCARGCRYCQAGFLSRPVRERSADTLLRQIAEGLGATGHDEVGLLSLSTGDYSDLKRLTQVLSCELSGKNVNVSLPSLRADSFDADCLRNLTGGRNLNLTFAPEVATEKMRAVVNKVISPDEIIESILAAADLGVAGVKLYFMVGLPFESEEDIEAIPSLVHEIDTAARRGSRRKLSFHVSVSGFVPKPHTPFQWVAQDQWETLKRKMVFVKESLGSQRHQVHYHDPRLSMIEGLLSRGDERVGRVVFEVYQRGSRFDAWSDAFSFENWLDACVKVGLDPADICHREREKDEEFPWSIIDCGVSREFLWEELEKARRGETTEDCTVGRCSRCGVCQGTPENHLAVNIPPGDSQSPLPPLNQGGQPGEISTTSETQSPHPPSEQGGQPVLFRYEKSGPLSWIGHIDFQRVVRQVFRRAGIRLLHSVGFHPYPRITFALPLPVGEAGANEALEAVLAGDAGEWAPEDLCRLLNANSPKGLRFREASPVSGERSLPSRVRGVVYRIRLETPPAGTVPRMRDLWEELRKRDKIEVVRVHRKKQTSQTVDLAPFLGDLSIETASASLDLVFSLSIAGGRTARESELLELLFPEGQPEPLEVTREDVLF